MILVGESLNVISTKIGRAFKERDPKPIQEEALFQKEKGMDYIDINLGPAKKDGHELMPWVVETVQEVVPDIPLWLDTSNIDAIEAGLKVCKNPPVVNSIMARPERYEKMIPLANQIAEGLSKAHAAGIVHRDLKRRERTGRAGGGAALRRQRSGHPK